MAVKMEGASPPVFEQIFRNARFAQGGNALFEGKVAGSPRPQVWWEGILNVSKWVIREAIQMFTKGVRPGCMDEERITDAGQRQAPDDV